VAPEEHLIKGSKILSTYLEPLGFKFLLVTKGQGSGGRFAHGQFVCEDRIIDLHFRYSLGLVSYQADNLILGHEDLIDLLDKKGQNQYPNFSDDPIDAFNCMKWDLKYLLPDFTENNAVIFRQRAPVKIKELEKIQIAKGNADKKIYSGDQKILEEAKAEFKKGNYLLVDKLKEQIKYPDLLTSTEKKLFELNEAKKKNNR
jgi:hypothetical protein